MNVMGMRKCVIEHVRGRGLRWVDWMVGWKMEWGGEC